MKEAIDRMKEYGMEDLTFIYHKNKPVVQKGGYRYEIQFIIPQDNGSVELTCIQVWPSYMHKLVYFTVDKTWRKSSVKHITDIMNKELDRIDRMFS